MQQSTGYYEQFPDHRDEDKLRVHLDNIIFFDFSESKILHWIKFSVKKTTLKNTGKVGEFCQSGKVGTVFPVTVCTLRNLLQVNNVQYFIIFTLITLLL